ncbi:MAG: TonB-dependent receptor [Chitinophagales bacterium]
MRKLLAILSAALMVVGVEAQQVKLSGIVTDSKSNSPLSNTTISQSGTNNSAATDSNGHYEFMANIGQSTIAATKVGYTETAVQVNLLTDTVINLSIAPKVEAVSQPVQVKQEAGTGKLKVYGTVTDEKDGSPMMAVNIIQKGTSNGAQTDLDGKYEIYLAPGTHTLDFSFVGYTTRSMLVTVLEKDKPLDVVMGIESKEMDIIVVTGTKYEKKLSEEVVSMEVVKASVLTQQSAKMDEAMNKVPGVNMLGKTIAIRGGSGFSDATGNRVLALLDEMPIISPENGSIVWEMMPIEALEQIEVIKGSSSALYGSSALNGVINMRTIQPKPEMVNKLLINYGFYDQPRQRTWNDWWRSKTINQRGDTVDRVHYRMYGGGQFTHAKQYGDFGVVLSASYQQDMGFRQSNDYKRTRLAAKLRYTPKKLSRLTAGLNMTFFHQTLKDFFAAKGIATLMYIPTQADVRTQARMFTIDPYLNYYDKGENRHSLKFRVFNNQSFSTTGDSTNSTQLYYDYSILHNFTKAALVVTAGTNGFYSNIKGKTFGQLVANINNIKYFSTREIMNFAAYIQAEKKFFQKLTISAGLRFEFARLSGETVHNRLPFINILNKAAKKTNDIQSPVTPLFRIGMNYQATKGTYIRASFGQGFRYPALAEKYVYTLRSGAQVFPNENLRPENGWSAELGIKQGVKISKWMAYFDASAYIMRYHDMIEFQAINYDDLADSIKPYVLGIPFQAMNVTDARIWGVEVSAVANGQIFGVPLNFLIGYSYLDPRNLDSVRAHAQVTTLKYRVQHSFKIDAQTTYKGFIIGVSAFYNSFMKEIDNVGIGALKVVSDFRKTHSKGYFVMDVRAGYNYKDKFLFNFIVKNILNTEYMLRPALIEPPRNYTFQVGYNF